MQPGSLARNHFQAVVRAFRGLYFLNVSRIFNDTGLRYRALNMITIPYIMLVGGHFKSEVGGLENLARFRFQAVVMSSRGLSFLEVSRKFNDTGEVGYP